MHVLFYVMNIDSGYVTTCNHAVVPPNERKSICLRTNLFLAEVHFRSTIGNCPIFPQCLQRL